MKTSYTLLGKLNGEPAISEKIFFLNQLSQNEETAVSPLFNLYLKFLVLQLYRGAIMQDIQLNEIK